MSVFDSVSDALSDSPGEEWQRALALSLAQAMDDSPSASTAKELRLLVLDLTAGLLITEKSDPVDDIAAKRAARRAAASSASTGS